MEYKVLYARWPKTFNDLINAAAKRLGSRNKTAKAYLNAGLQAFLTQRPWEGRSPCFPKARDVRTYDRAETGWVNYNLTVPREVAEGVGKQAASLNVSNASFVLGMLLWWFEEDLEGQAELISRLEELAEEAELPLWSAANKAFPSSEPALAPAPKPQAKTNKRQRFKSVDNLSIPCDDQHREEIAQVLHAVEGRSKDGCLYVDQILSVACEYFTAISALGLAAAGSTLECVGSFAENTDLPDRAYVTSVTLLFDGSILLVSSARRKIVRTKEGGKCVLTYSPLAEFEQGRRIARALCVERLSLSSHLKQRYGAASLAYWMGLINALQETGQVDGETAKALMVWKIGKTPTADQPLSELITTLSDSSSVGAKIRVAAVMASQESGIADKIDWLTRIRSSSEVSKMESAESMESEWRPSIGEIDLGDDF